MYRIPMKITSLFSMLFALWLLSGCSSGKQSYEKGNYYQSVTQAVDRLRKNPDHKKSRMVLAESYPLAVRYYTDQIDRLRNSGDPFKNSRMTDIYATLNSLYEDIQRSPGAMAAVQPQSFHGEYERHRQQAAEEQYAAGATALDQSVNTGDRQLAKTAFQHFANADRYVPGFRDVATQLDDARYFATLKVRVEQVPVPTLQYQISVQFFQDQIEQFLFNYRENEFVRFFPANDQSLEHPDQILVIQLEDFVVGQTNNLQKIQEVSRDSVVLGQVKLESGQSTNVYGTVKASFTENRSEVISKGLMSMRIIDSRSNSVTLHEKFPGQFTWFTQWGNYNGDERALTDEQIRITKQRPIPPPPPQELFIEFCKPIYSQWQGAVRSYYRNM
jgi:hypothetical protein